METHSLSGSISSMVALVLALISLLFTTPPYNLIAKSIVLIAAIITTVLYFIDKDYGFGSAWVVGTLIWFGNVAIAFSMYLK